MHWSWRDLMECPMPVYHELITLLVDEAHERQHADALAQGRA